MKKYILSSVIILSLTGCATHNYGNPNGYSTNPYCNGQKISTGQLIGGILGGSLGSRIGGGNGKLVAIGAGAIAGSIVGQQLECK